MMKKILSATVVCILMFVACDSKRITIPMVRNYFPETVKFTPAKIVLEELDTCYVKYPKFNGGECFYVTFYIIFGDPKTEELIVFPVTEIVTSSEDTKGAIKGDKRIIKILHFYEVMKKVKPSQIIVRLTDNEVSGVLTTDGIELF